MKVSYRKTPTGRWEGVLRDENNKIIWACGHSHKCRDYNHSKYFKNLGAARYCAEEELDKRMKEAKGE